MEEPCHICSRPLDEIYAVSCLNCDKKSHFESAEPQGSNCGRILTELDQCGLSFICNDCLDKIKSKDAKDSI